MAEKLLDAIAKGSYKAVADPVKQTVKAAVDPNVMSTIFRTGIIGPLIQNAISEYKKGERKEGGNLDSAIVSDLSKNLNSLSVQLSSIADIMDDIRTLNSQQLKVDKDQFVRERKETKKAEYKSLEDKIEAKKPGISSLMTGAKQKFTDSIFGDIAGFVKNNPILSGLIVGTLTFFSKELQEFFQGVLEGSEFEKTAREAVKRLRDGIASNVKSIFKDIGIEIDSSFANIFGSTVLGGILGAVIPGKRFGITAGKGAVAGAGVGIGQEIAGEGDSFINNPIFQAILSLAASMGISYGAGKVADRIFRKPTSPVQTTKPSPSGILPTPSAQSKQSMPYETMEEKRVRERKAVRASERGSIKKYAERIKRIFKKMGQERFLKFMAFRFKVFVGSLFGGPVGLILGIISAGYTMYQIGEVLDEIEQADTEGYDGSAQEMSSGIQRPEIGAAPDRRLRETESNPTIKPPLSSFNMDDYTSKVMAAESGGQNIQNPLGTAYGVFQITKKTFEGIRKNNEDLKQFSYEQFQQNTEIQKKFFDALTKENANALERAGFEPDQKNLYLAHRFGITDALSILRKSKEPGGMNEPLSSVIPAGRFKQIDEQNPDISAGTTIAGAMLGAYAKMDKNITMNKQQSALAAITPETNPLENLSFIKELQNLQTAFTGKPSTIIMDNSQNTSMGGSSPEANRAQAPTTLPYVHERDILTNRLYRHFYPSSMGLAT